jgi:hypothetical protein
LQEFSPVVDFLIGLAFVAIVFAPAIAASIRCGKSRDGEL